MNDLEQRLKDVLDTDAAKAPRVPRAPEGLKRQVRRRQVGTALIGTFAIVAVLGASLAGVRAIERSEGTTLVDDPWAGYRVFERTAQIENFTITSPSDLYLVNQWPWSVASVTALRKAADRARDDCMTQPRGQARKDCVDATFGPGMGTVVPIFQLSNTDRGLSTSPCMAASTVAPDEIVMTISYDYLASAASFGAGDQPVWPVTYTEGADYDRTPCDAGIYVPFASPDGELGSYPYLAHVVAGDDVSDDDRQAVIDAFNTMEVGGIERFDAGDEPNEPAYVLAGGENAAGPWTLQLRTGRSPDSGPRGSLELSVINQEGGTTITDPRVSEDSPIVQAGGDPVYGVVTEAATGVEVRSASTTSAEPAQLIPLPPSVPSDFDVFFASNASDEPATASPLGLDGPIDPTLASPTVGPETDNAITVSGDDLDIRWTLELSGSIEDDSACIDFDAGGIDAHALCHLVLPVGQSRFWTWADQGRFFLVGSAPAGTGISEIRAEGPDGVVATGACSAGPAGWNGLVGCVLPLAGLDGVTKIVWAAGDVDQFDSTDLWQPPWTNDSGVITTSGSFLGSLWRVEQRSYRDGIRVDLIGYDVHTLDQPSLNDPIDVPMPAEAPGTGSGALVLVLTDPSVDGVAVTSEGRWYGRWIPSATADGAEARLWIIEVPGSGSGTLTYDGKDAGTVTWGDLGA